MIGKFLRLFFCIFSLLFFSLQVIPVRMGFGGAKLPMQCSRVALDGEDKCPRDPYTILPDKSHCVDHQVWEAGGLETQADHCWQVLKLQENPEDVPTGEMPRHVIMSVDRHLTNKVAPARNFTPGHDGKKNITIITIIIIIIILSASSRCVFSGRSWRARDGDWDLRHDQQQASWRSGRQ